MKTTKGLIQLALILSVGQATAQVPAPAEVFGFSLGEDYKLADYGQMLEYYRRLDQASDRLEVMEIGPTAEGRPMILALISSPENLSRRDEYRRISQRLALGEAAPEEAEELSRRGKVIVWIDGGLHSTEVAHAQHSPELAYRLASGDDPETTAILDSAILLQVPVMNPDGLEKVVRWYRGNVGTPYETSPLPELYHKYVGHDNNRDWYMLTQPESRNVARVLYHEWYPQIVFNHHQGAPYPSRIFVPPFARPMNPRIPALVLRGIDLIGAAMASRFEAEGKSGVVSRVTYTTWWNGGMRTVPYFHNMVGILTETALYKYATPHLYEPSSLPEKFSNGIPALEPGPDYPNPWRGGWWRLRDAMDYMMTASLSVLDTAVRYRQQWLGNAHRLALQSLRAGEQENPFAFLIPPDQNDPSAAIELLKALQGGGLVVHRAQQSFQAGEQSYPAGTFILYAAQPFRPYLLDLMEPQKYPDLRRFEGGPPEAPYDVTGWTLPLQMGVRSVPVENPFSVVAARLPAAELEEPPLPQPARWYLIDRRWNQSYRLANDLLARGLPVRVLRSPVEIGRQKFAPGCFLVDSGQSGQVAERAAFFRVPLHAVPDPERLDVDELRQPRVGLYKSWVANMDEGWTRWLLESFHFPFQTLTNDDIRSGGLRAGLDVLILPSQSSNSILKGYSEGEMPPRFTGGIGVDGVLQLKAFLEAGGILVALDEATQFPLGLLDLPVRNVLSGVAETEFYCPGSLLRLKIDASDPLGYGMPEEAVGFFVNSPAFQMQQQEGAGSKETRAHLVATYPDGDLLLSGWLLGGRKLRGKSAVLRLPFHSGQIVLIGLRAQFRGQPHGTFKLLFNSIYLGGMVKPPSGS